MADNPAAVPLVFWFSVGNVQFVSVPLLGVPSAGVTSVGLVANTLLPDPVLVTDTTFLLASSASAVDAVRPEKVTVLDADSVVKLPSAPPSTRCQTVPLNPNC